jgi:hypothetical protein
MKEALQSGPLCALAGPTGKVHHLTLMFYVAVECILGQLVSISLSLSTLSFAFGDRIPKVWSP